MLAVAQIDYIRHEVNQKGETYASVGRRMNIDPRTVHKYANKEEFSRKEKQTRVSPIMDPVKPIIDKWLTEDLRKKRKYQRTAKRMFEQLRDFHSFKGAYRTVRAYVAKRKKELKAINEGAAIPLESIPGTAQVDFGTAPFKYQSKVIDLPYLVMSFPFSNSFYFQVFPSENTECLLEGLQRMFHHMGGVPHTIRFDNLSPAVKKIRAKGEKLDLLILDELGYIPLNKEGAELLFQVISMCYETKSIVITTNLQFGQWNHVFGDPILTEAVIDRLIHHSHLLLFTGESYRYKESLLSD